MYILVKQCFSQSSKQRGGRIEKTTTSKGLVHSNDHIKENWATIGGGGEAPPTLLWGNHCTVNDVGLGLVHVLCTYVTFSRVCVRIIVQLGGMAQSEKIV